MRERPAATKPTRLGAVAFRTKAAAFQIRRGVVDAARGPRKHRRGVSHESEPILAESTTPLWYADPADERVLEAGKVHNLRLAARALDGVEIGPNAVFSFWTQIGRLTRRRGYVTGRELREGCVVPAVGGGICQLSNALFDAADRAGLEIVERHRHSRVVAGSLAEIDRDATVFWNYVDLRLRAPFGFRIEVRLSDDALVVRIRGEERRARRLSQVRLREHETAANECSSCAEYSCFRKSDVPAVTERFGRAAFLVDEHWPELDDYVSRERTSTDVIGLPLDGRARHRANYAWTTDGFGAVREALVASAMRSFVSRRLSTQGAERQRALLRSDERLARSLARALTFDVTHVTVAQNLLPFLWRDGHLGGRTFDVLATRLPLYVLHERLDDAAACNDSSPTLADFRADDRIVQWEMEALDHARRVVTPHSEIARVFGERARRLRWSLPVASARPEPGELVVFPGPTVGRKGAYELRAVARDLGLSVAVGGSMLEGADFWQSVPYERFDLGTDDWLSGAAVVVAPSWVEHRPRRLLEAIARGVPVVASEACGLAGIAGVVEVPTGNVRALREAVSSVIAASARSSRLGRPFARRA